MAQKTFILYDLKGKTNAEKTAIIRKLYDYRDNSNYRYNYTRAGALSKLNIEKSKKTVLQIRNTRDLTKVVEILKNLNIQFEIAKA